MQTRFGVSVPGHPISGTRSCVKRAARGNQTLPALVAGVFLFQRRPYERQIYMERMTEIHTSPVRGLTGRHTLLTIFLDSRSVNIMPADPLPQAVIQTLSQHVDRAVVVQLTPDR